MATATVTRDWKEVTTTKRVRTGVTLDLSNVEAITLRSILRLVGGNPDTTARRHANSISKALGMAEVPWRTAHMSGEIVFSPSEGYFAQAALDLEKERQ